MKNGKKRWKNSGSEPYTHPSGGVFLPKDTPSDSVYYKKYKILH